MADPIGGTGLSIGDILSYGGMAVGAAIAAIAVRLGWNSGGKPIVRGDEGIVEVKNAIVDSKSIILLTASIEAHAFTARELAKRGDDNLDRLYKVVEVMTDEIRNLSREVRELAREVANRA